MDKPDTGNIVSTSTLEVIKDTYSEDAKEVFPQIGPVERTSQQTILPAAVKQRFIAPIQVYGRNEPLLNRRQIGRAHV